MTTAHLAGDPGEIAGERVLLAIAFATMRLSEHSTAAAPGRSRDPERGSALIIALLALVALLGIGGVTILAVQSGVASAGDARFQGMAAYAAESGVNAGMEFLRANCNTTTYYSAFVSPSNTAVQQPTGLFGNHALPGAAQNVFSQQTWYEVSILNNTLDPQFAAATNSDSDADVILRSIGHGPNNSTVTLDVEVRNAACLGTGIAGGGGGYASKGGSQYNIGTNYTSGNVNISGGVTTISPP